jgi:HK97 family phage prohead protease
MKRELRIYKGSEIRAKKTENQIEGHAAIFNDLSQDLGGFYERVMPGAFSDDLKTNPDVRALFNHDPNIVLGRTTSRTLRLSEDAKGLAYVVDMPDTQHARDLTTSIERGDISHCSFGFYVTSQKWSQEPDPADPTGKSQRLVRELHKVATFDVSPVTYPAYTGTDVDTRRLFPDGIPGEVRAHVPGLNRRHASRDGKTEAELEIERRAASDECACNCANCASDNCANCSMGDDCTDPDCEHDDESADRSMRAQKRAAAKAAKAAAAAAAVSEIKPAPAEVIAIDDGLEKQRMRARLAGHQD